MQTLQSFTDVLIQGMHLPALIPDRKVHLYSTEVVDRMGKIDQALKEAAPLIKLPKARLPQVSNEEDLRSAVEAWATVRERGLKDQDIGDLTWEGDIAEASVYELDKKFDVVQYQCNVRKKVHRIARPHLERYPCGVDIPKKGMKIIKAFEKAGLLSEVRILTGDLIGKSETLVRSFNEPTALGRAIGIAEKSINRVLNNSFEALTSVFKFDPAICIGTKVFYLWEL